ncbi:phosphatase [Bacteroidia bacterium]|nr:phosphatase [Bacteroidia bacterium]
MENLKVALFDMDGVIVDTEPIYDLFWKDAGERYHTGIENFADVIKGTTLPDIIEKYFSSFLPEEVEQLVREVEAYEATMPLPAMAGSIEFLQELKANGVRMGLVTSSGQDKVERALALYRLEEVFGTVVSEGRITKGKPNPMCYLLAATDLNVEPEDCIVFEDSFNGIRAGSAAGMRVIGLSTTNPAESLAGMVHEVIPNFKGVGFSHYLEWCK